MSIRRIGRMNEYSEEEVEVEENLKEEDEKEELTGLLLSCLNLP